MNESITRIMQQINACWLEGRPDDLADYFHPEIVMVLPGFADSIVGCKQMIDGFRDFTENTVVYDYNENDVQVHVIGDSAIVTFTFEMIYQRDAQKYQSTGRDLWVFTRQDKQWLAVWRTMLDVKDNPL